MTINTDPGLSAGNCPLIKNPSKKNIKRLTHVIFPAHDSEFSFSLGGERYENKIRVNVVVARVIKKDKISVNPEFNASPIQFHQVIPVR